MSSNDCCIDKKNIDKKIIDKNNDEVVTKTRKRSKTVEEQFTEIENLVQKVKEYKKMKEPVSKDWAKLYRDREERFEKLRQMINNIEPRYSPPSSSQLFQLKSLKSIRRKRMIYDFFMTIIYLVIFVLFLWTIQYVFKIGDGSKCLATTPSIAQKLFRPPENCLMCQDVQQVDRLAAVDPEIFEERYAYSGKPVVITDAMVNWTAPEVFSFSFFKTLYREEKGSSGRCQFFPYETDFQSLQDVFDMSADRAAMEKDTKPWYVGWSNCDEEIGTILREHYQKPYFLPATAETKKTDWIFMGSKGYGAPMHVDNVDLPSWQAQIKGEKLWILEPPRECHYVCKKLEVTVHPGEIIVLDTNRWYHKTQIVSDDMSITIGAEYD